MNRSPSLRLMKAGTGMFGVGVAMFAGSIASGVAHLPMAVVVVFVVLALCCALAGFILIGMGATRNKAENSRLVAGTRTKRE